METDIVVIKQEPADDSNYGNNFVHTGGKRKAEDELDSTTKRSSSAIVENIYNREKGQLSFGSRKDINANSGKFQCLICDDAFITDEQLTNHLSVIHKHSSPPRRPQSRFARHTCQVCFAKFRTLKDFFNHTSCHAVQPGLNNIDREISAKVTNNISKNALQHYFRTATSNLERDLLQPSFRCDCCNTVFLNRDSYAMHVMMRVKNEACRPNGSLCSFNSDPNTESMEKIRKPEKPNNSDTKSNAESPAPLNQAYYVDVTTTPDRDEYLMSLLRKTDMSTVNTEVNSTNAINTESESRQTNVSGRADVSGDGIVMDALRSAIGKGKKCLKCDDVYYDQDSLAMHVMSKHSQEAGKNPDLRHQCNEPTSSMSVTGGPFKHFSPYADRRLLSVHTGVLFCDYCGQSFVNRDALAMHVLSHTRDPESQVLFKFHHNNAIFDYLRVASMREAVSLSSLRKLSEKHEEIINDEPLNLVSEIKQFEVTGNEGEKITESIEVGDSVAKLATEETESKISSYHEKELKYRTIEKLNVTKVLHLATRSSSAPPPNCDVITQVERAASTGCLPSDGYIKDLATSSMLPRITENVTEGYPEHNLKMAGMDMRMLHKPSFVERLDANKKDKFGDVCPDFPFQIDDKERKHMVDLMSKNKDVYMCRYCEIIFPSRTLYYLHMGLHNHNRPLQCNMCGRICENVNDFNAHIIHL